jgi:glycopeptide antibiotics resistance protein
MMRLFKKIAVFLPVLVVGIAYLAMRYHQQGWSGGYRKWLLPAFSLMLFYGWVLIGILRRRQLSFFEMLVQASFYVFIFCVLTLTGYFIFFKQVAAHDWWHRLLVRINTRDGVNLKAFTFFKRGNLFSYEVIGNAVMLFPLGIYLPLLYKRLHNFFVVTGVALLVAISIELMELATNFRIADIDDVILNTAGAAGGFIVYALAIALSGKPIELPNRQHLYR